MIAPDHHAQLNRSICYILVYTSTCAFPILLGYSLWLYYLALHYLLTRGCDYLIGRYRDNNINDIRNLRDYFRVYDIYILKDRKRIAENLTIVVNINEYYKWTETEINEKLKFNK